LIVGAFNAVIQSTPSWPRISSRFASVTIPRSATTTTGLSKRQPIDVDAGLPVPSHHHLTVARGSYRSRL